MCSASNIRCLGASLGVLAVMLAASGAPAEVKISNVATKNMSCAAGVCTPTSNHAVLNAGALQTMLASGDVEVTTSGAGAQAKDIVVASPLSWASTHALTLDAFQSITVDNPISITGRSALTLTTNDGGAGGVLSFTANGAVTFTDLASSLAINGVAYTLVGTVQGLASAVAANRSGDYALAISYDAKPDGIYANAPVGGFSGRFEGLGNHISNLQVAVTEKGASASLFVGLGNDVGQIRDVGLENVKLSSTTGWTNVGALAGSSGGNIEHCFATGTARTGANSSYVGGLVGENFGTVRRSWAAVSVTGESAGGLVGINFTGGAVSESFSQGSVTSRNGYSQAGGLVGYNKATIVDSYATSSVTGPYSHSSRAAGGGMVAENAGAIATSYSTGTVSGFLYQGGLIGQDDAHAGSLSDTYWDTNTSGFPGPGQGAGTPANDPGITGLTTAQLQSGLPAGFGPSIWAESPGINGGLPYLIANPPPQ